MKKKLYGAIALVAMLAAPALAEAATRGFATANVNMRSGPSTAYPAVVVIPVGAPLTVHGCLSDTPWCDVSFVNGRGWVAGRYIQTTFRQNRVYVEPRYYRDLGVPIITFEAGRYWDRYYRDRDFYRERDRCVARRHQAATGTPRPRVPDGIAHVRVTTGAMVAGTTGVMAAAMSGVIPARAVVRMMVVGSVATATGTRATEIRTGRVATMTAAVGKMKIATATAMASRPRMKVNVGRIAVNGTIRGARPHRKIFAVAAESAILVVMHGK